MMRAGGRLRSAVAVAGTRAASSGAAARVQVDRAANGVATVRLNRADKLNSLDMDMFRSIARTARELAADRSVRAVVVHGDGRAFCAGLDVRSVNHPLHARANGAELLERPQDSVSNLAQDVCYLWRRIPAPVIAATHGVCLGGGFQIALGADMRISTPGCKFSIMEVRRGRTG
jgi:enoyl-CoA hydratase/carnithine racemase